MGTRLASARLGGDVEGGGLDTVAVGALLAFGDSITMAFSAVFWGTLLGGEGDGIKMGVELLSGGVKN